MIESDNILIQTKEDIYYRILGDSFLSQVPVLIHDEHDLDNRAKVDEATGNFRDGKTGACIIASAVNILSIETGETPMPLMNMAIFIDVLEDVLINAGPDGSGKNAGVITARIVQLMHHLHIDDRFSGFRLSDTAPIQELFTETQGERGYRVRFEAGEIEFCKVPTVASVDIAETAGEITLSCGTSGASILYTIDGSYPGSGNTDAVQAYSAPFTPGPGVIVRASAEKANLNPSKYIASHEVAA